MIQFDLSRSIYQVKIEVRYCRLAAKNRKLMTCNVVSHFPEAVVKNQGTAPICLPHLYFAYSLLSWSVCFKRLGGNSSAGPRTITLLSPTRRRHIETGYEPRLFWARTERGLDVSSRPLCRIANWK